MGNPTLKLIRVTHPADGPVFEFNKGATKDEVAKAIFKAALPSGVNLVPRLEGDASVEWQVRGPIRENYQYLNGNLGYIVITGTQVVPVAEYEADRAARVLDYNRMLDHYIPELDSTPRQLNFLGDGAHVVNNHFVWIGQIRDGTHVIQYHPRATEQFNKDIQFYLDQGLSLTESVSTFSRQWDSIYSQLLSAFALTIAYAGGMPSTPKGGALNQLLEAVRTGTDLLGEVKLPDTAIHEEVRIPEPEENPKDFDPGSTSNSDESHETVSYPTSNLDEPSENVDSLTSIPASISLDEPQKDDGTDDTPTTDPGDEPQEADNPASAQEPSRPNPGDHLDGEESSPPGDFPTSTPSDPGNEPQGANDAFPTSQLMQANVGNEQQDSGETQGSGPYPASKPGQPDPGDEPHDSNNAQVNAGDQTQETTSNAQPDPGNEPQQTNDTVAIPSPPQPAPEEPPPPEAKERPQPVQGGGK